MPTNYALISIDAGIQAKVIKDSILVMVIEVSEFVVLVIGVGLELLELALDPREVALDLDEQVLALTDLIALDLDELALHLKELVTKEATQLLQFLTNHLFIVLNC